MAIRNSNGAGGGDWHNAASWAIAIPAGADTFNILAGDTITVQTAGGAVGCAGGTIAVGGTLQDNSTAGFTLTGAVTHSGTFGMAGSGSNVTPTLMTLNGCVWTCGTAAIWNVVGTLPYTAPDVKIVGNATSYFDFAIRNGITGTITRIEFNTFGHASGVLYRISSYNGSNLNIYDLYFNATVSSCIAGGACYITGNVLINSTSANYCIQSQTITGSSIITIQNSTATTTGRLNACYFYDTTRIIKNEGMSTAAGMTALNFWDYTYFELGDLQSNSGLDRIIFSGNSSCKITTTGANRVYFTGTTGGIIDSSGLVELIGPNGITFKGNIYNTELKNWRISVVTGTVILASVLNQQDYWQQSRSVRFRILGATGITLNGGTAFPQYEPILYEHDETNYLFAIQYDMTVGCPNYTALYGASTGWTAATKTLAAGGVLRIYSTGHTATGMDMAISDLSGFTLATTGTATINTAEYYISFDGGVLWSGALTLTQLRANSYTINGNSYTTDPTSDIQLRIVLTSTLGGTVTQVVVTGIEYDPVNLSSYNIRDDLTAVKGAGFVTGTHDLKSIHDDLYAVNNYATALSGLSYRSGKVHAVCSGLFEANSKFFKVKYF